MRTVSDPRFPKPEMLKVTLGDKLHHLALLSPDDLRAIEVFVDYLLEHRSPRPPKHERDVA